MAIKTIQGILKRTPFYLPMRKLYLRWNPVAEFHLWTDKDQQRFEFYSSFIKEGDLVFDVGANRGNRSKIFRKLGAKVIAFEPQESCADYLRTVLGNDPGFTLESVALGENDGTGEMLISRADTLSTLSKNWVQSTTESGRFSDYSWDGKQTVTITTLDHMLKKHGIPSFVKIDVEGFEQQVVAGLSRPLNALSIEFAPENIDGSFKCIDHLATLAEIKLNFSLGESMQLDFQEWLGAVEMKAYLSALDDEVCGDIYIRSATAAAKL